MWYGADFTARHNISVRVRFVSVLTLQPCQWVHVRQTGPTVYQLCPNCHSTPVSTPLSPPYPSPIQPSTQSTHHHSTHHHSSPPLILDTAHKSAWSSPAAPWSPWQRALVIHLWTTTKEMETKGKGGGGGRGGGGGGYFSYLSLWHGRLHLLIVGSGD